MRSCLQTQGLHHAGPVLERTPVRRVCVGRRRELADEGLPRVGQGGPRLRAGGGHRPHGVAVGEVLSDAVETAGDGGTSNLPNDPQKQTQQVPLDTTLSTRTCGEISPSYARKQVPDLGQTWPNFDTMLTKLDQV